MQNQLQVVYEDIVKQLISLEKSIQNTRILFLLGGISILALCVEGVHIFRSQKLCQSMIKKIENKKTRSPMQLI